MNNLERVKKIDLVREIRRDLGNFKFLTNEEKAIALKALNDYEFSLNMEITRSLNVKKELDSEGIENDIDIVSVPLDSNCLDYKKIITSAYEGIDVNIFRLVDTLFKVPSFDLEDSKKRILLEALKEYVEHLKQLKLQQKNNYRNSKNLYQDSDINTKSEIVASRPVTSKLSQSKRFSELYDKIRIEDSSKNK